MFFKSEQYLKIGYIILPLNPINIENNYIILPLNPINIENNYI